MSLATQSSVGVILSLRGNTAIWWSTDDRVAIPGTGFAWDVRGYYRTLGIPFPYVNASPADLSRAYMARDGQSSAWMTYCLKQLLKKTRRRRYDAAHLGSLFRDEYTDAVERDRIMAARASSAKPIDAETMDAEYVEEHGEAPADDTRDEDLDNAYAARQDGSTPAGTQDAYPFGVYILSDTPDRVEVNPEALAEWMRLIRKEARFMHLRTEVAMGVTDSPDADWSVGQIGARNVVLIHGNATPSPLDAERIVMALH